MSLQVREGFPLFDNRHDVFVDFLNGNLGLEVDRGGIFHASLFLQDLGDVRLEDFQERVALGSFYGDGCQYVYHDSILARLV